MPQTSILNSYFDSVVFLTTVQRPERTEQMRKELQKHSIEAVPFYAVSNHDSRVSFNLSMIEILKKFIASGAHRILILEDDVIFSDMITLEKSLSELDYTIDWDMFYLGANTWTFPFTVQSEHLIRIHGAWTTHAVAYTLASARKIVDQFSKTDMHSIVYDDWLAHEFHPHNKCFLAWPLCAIQRPNYSDLLQQNVDYEICWQNTRKKITRAIRQFRIDRIRKAVRIHR